MLNISNLGLDVADEIISFLAPVECRSLATTCKYFLKPASNDKLWCAISLRHISGFQGYTAIDVEQLKISASITSMYRLYCAFRTLQFDLFGYYAACAVDGGTLRAYATMSMIRIDSANHPLRCDHVLPGGVVRREEIYNYWTITYDESSWSMRLLQRPSTSRLQFSTDIRFIDEDRSVHGQMLSNMVLRPLPPLVNMVDPRSGLRRSLTYVSSHMTLLRQNHPLGQQLHPCLTKCVGIFTAIYGPHGCEILHLSVEETAGDGAARLELKAMKATGDRNVPAGNHSFIIDLSHSLDFAEEMQRDTRQVSVMSPALPTTSMVLNFSERRPSIAKWYRGKGQINRVPGVWAPEWVDCSLIIYEDLLPSTGARCTVIWEDADSLLWRHAMDINPLIVENSSGKNGSMS